ncbi:uncharacterized protein LOC116846830 [Odontomachus brunneus]|uniref:uncharacterized protein LOC116846830 n=1 Tax=Odontomachus brunneus TaxID=486640 RepID=UPI0013F2212B|nr:uncharacterized protein LOC116846830 [Odontomachus brunneus]
MVWFQHHSYCDLFNHSLHDQLYLGFLKKLKKEMEGRRLFHIRNNPFDLSNKDFIRLYRINKRITENIIDIVTTAIRFMASGSYQTDIQFWEKYDFPGIIGRIDCTHVAIVTIVAPPKHHPQFPEHIYVNRKGYHSINVQLICDSDLKIIHLNVNIREVHTIVISGIIVTFYQF